MQPWASLLVHGIKRIEGRDWPSHHRGRVWIHATAQEPDQKTVQVGPGWADVWQSSSAVGYQIAPGRHACISFMSCMLYQELEDFYRKVHAAEEHEPEFPEKYPTGVLLGCVTVVDVLTVCKCPSVWSLLMLLGYCTTQSSMQAVSGPGLVSSV